MSDLPEHQMEPRPPGRGERRSLEADFHVREEDPLRADRLVSTGRQFASPKPSVAAGWDMAADLWKDPAEVPELAETPVPDHLRQAIEGYMAKYPDPRSAVLPALFAAQREHGYLSPEAMRQVAAVMKVTPAYLSSVASFYDMLNEQPRGRRYVYVCTSVACHLLDANRVYHAIEEAARMLGLEDVEIRQFECLGACDMAPMASVDGRFVGPLKPSDAPNLVLDMKNGNEVLPGRGLGDEDYVGRGGNADPPPQEPLG